MDYPHYSVDGIPLNDEAGRWFIDGGTLRVPPLPAARAVEVAVPGVHGVLPVTGLDLEPTTLGGTLIVTDVTPAGSAGGDGQLFANLDALKGTVGQRWRMSDLRYHLAPGRVRQAEAMMISGAEPELLQGSPATARVPLLWQIPAVFWRDIEAATWQGDLAALDGTAVDTLAGSTAPVVDAVLRVGADATDPWVRDDATGATVTYDGILSGTERLLVDCGRMRAAVVTTDTWDLGAGTDVTGDMASSGPGASARWLHLTPQIELSDPTRRLVRISVGAAASTGAVVEVRGRRAYQ